jgi:hypothetical protein
MVGRSQGTLTGAVTGDIAISCVPLQNIVGIKIGVGQCVLAYRWCARVRTEV